MPSLSAKSEPVAMTDATEFANNMISMMEKKIRNLEKRKSKLEDYRAKQASGTTLTEEQLTAMSHLDGVMSQIELLKDLIKQSSTFSQKASQAQKKRVKQERLERVIEERKRFASVLRLQQVLNLMGEEETRTAFNSGVEGTVKLEKEELDHLDELYKIISPERGSRFAASVDQSAEHLQHMLDSKDKAVIGTTYEKLYSIVSQIQDCPYLNQTPSTEEDTGDNTTEKEFVVVETSEVPHADSEEVQASLPSEVLPPEEPVVQEPVPAFPKQVIEHTVVDEPPKTFEKIVENVQGMFNFIQDSQIDMDSPSHVDPAVVAVQQMPTAHYPAVPTPEHAVYTQPDQYQHYSQPTPTDFQTVDATAAFHQDAPAPIPMPNDPAAHQFQSQSPVNEMFSQNTQEPDQANQEDGFQQRGQNRRGNRSGYRGPRGGTQPTNGFRGGRGGGYRGGDRGGFRGGDRHQGDRENNKFSKENGFQDRQGPRGGPRGGRGGFQGNSGPRSGRGGRGGMRGHSQTATVDQH